MRKKSIKATIDANIKQNGVQAITGQIMNSVLNQMVDNLAEEASTTEKLTELEKKIEGNEGWIDVKGKYQSGDCWLYGDLSDYNAGIANHVRYHEIDISEFAGDVLKVKCYFENPVGSGFVNNNNVVVGRLAEKTSDIQEVEIPNTAAKLRISNDTSKVNINDVIITVKKVEKPINIVNDLTTGGINDALSAEMGKQLGIEVFGGFSSIKPDTVTQNKAYLGDLSPYNYGGTNCNRFEPINISQYVGQRIRIRAFVPSGKQVASGFVNANNKALTKLSFDTDEYQEFIIEEEAKELRLCFSASKTSEVSVEIEEEGLSERIDAIGNKKVSFMPIMSIKGSKGKAVGDSITAGSNGGVSYVDKVAELLGITYQNNGFPGDTIGSMTSRNLIQSTDADFVTIFGGTNDFNLDIEIGTIDDDKSQNTFYGKLANSYETHKKANPNVPLFYLTPCRRYDIETNGLGLKLDSYVDAMISFCNKNKLMVIDLYYTGLIPNSNSCIGDMLHLNDSGATELAAYIAKMLPYFVMVNRQWK